MTKIQTSIQTALVSSKYQSLQSELNERTRRLWAATEARALGHGGIQLVARVTGLARTTISDGLNELDHPEVRAPQQYTQKKSLLGF